MSEPFELHSQPVLLLHIRIVVQTHWGRLCSTEQTPVKRMSWPPCNCDHVSSPRRTSLNTSWLPLMLPHVFWFTVAWIMQGCSLLWPCVLCFCFFQRDNMRQEETATLMPFFPVLSVTAICVVKFLLEKFILICRLCCGIDASWNNSEIYKICLYPEGYLTVKC